MSGRLHRLLVMPWQACGYRGKACRKRSLLIENSTDYLTATVYKFTGQLRWNYAIQFRDGITSSRSTAVVPSSSRSCRSAPLHRSGSRMIVAPRARLEGYTRSEKKSMAIVDEFLTDVLKMELITLEQMKRYKVMS